MYDEDELKDSDLGDNEGVLADDDFLDEFEEDPIGDMEEEEI